MRTVPVLVALALVLTALPLALPAAADHGLPHDDGCRDGTAGANFAGASANGNALQANGQSFALPRGLLHLVVSADGHVDVDVAFRCIEVYHFVAVKNGVVSGPSVEVDTWQPKACGSGVDTYQLPVGLDFAHYDLFLEWHACDGTACKDHRSIDVFDPPVPWYLA